MEIHLKKPHLTVLCNAFGGDSIVSPDINHFYWRHRQTKLNPEDFAILFESDLMSWADGMETGQLANEGFITKAGRNLVEELELCTYAYSR